MVAPCAKCGESIRLLFEPVNEEKPRGHVHEDKSVFVAVAVGNRAVVVDVHLDMIQYVDDRGGRVTRPFICRVLLRQADVAAWALVMPSAVVLGVKELYLRMSRAVTHVLQALEVQVTEAGVPDQATVAMSGVRQISEGYV